jgi:transcription initiation factor IIE alpha subunit
MSKKIYRSLCNHNSGICIITKKVYSSGCNFEYEVKYITCSRCGKVLVDSDTLEELTGITSAKL